MQNAFLTRLARIGLALPALAMLTAADPPPVSSRILTGTWVIGYALEVERVCPAWRLVPKSVLVQRGLIDRTIAVTALGFDSPLSNAHWNGAEAAQRDRTRHPTFCIDPARLHPNAPIAQAIERVPRIVP